MKAKIINGVVSDLQDDAIADILKSVDSSEEWVTATKATKTGQHYSGGKFIEPPEEADAVTPEIPEAYIGLNFSLEDIAACEDGTKTIDQVKKEMAE